MTTILKKTSAFVASLALVATFAAPVAVFAQDLNLNTLGVNAIEDDIVLGGGDVRATAARLINVALGFLGIIAVVIVLIGGFKYMVSGGNEEKTGEARKLIFSGIIGLAIILSAWAITGFVLSQLINATQGS
ncbi:MAG: Type secretion system pilin [Candidatus Parcubacteria bacterium]|jgi:hypothetical protein